MKSSTFFIGLLLATSLNATDLPTSEMTILKEEPSSSFSHQEALYCVPVQEVILSEKVCVKRNNQDGKIRLMWRNEKVSFDLSDNLLHGHLLPAFINESEKKPQTETLFISENKDREYKTNLLLKNLLYCVLVNLSPKKSAQDTSTFVSGTMKKILEKYKSFYIYKGSKNTFPPEKMGSYYKVTLTDEKLQTVVDMQSTQ